MGLAQYAKFDMVEKLIYDILLNSFVVLFRWVTSTFKFLTLVMLLEFDISLHLHQTYVISELLKFV